MLTWVEQRTRQLELTEKVCCVLVEVEIQMFTLALQELWPSNGLEMISSVMEAVQSFRNSSARMSIHANAMDFWVCPPHRHTVVPLVSLCLVQEFTCSSTARLHGLFSL